MKTAKEIYELIKEKPYKDSEQMIKDYAKQKCQELIEKIGYNEILFTSILNELEFE